MNTPAAPTALISWAHRNTDWDENQAATWKQSVLAFTVLMRDNGVAADLDLWHTHKTTTDWTRWGPQKVQDSDFVIVAMSEAWAERWSGGNAVDVGAGAVAEADALKGIFGTDQALFQRKAVLVLLPGITKTIIPVDLYRLRCFEIAALTTAGIDGLLRAILNKPKFVMPALGAAPELPPDDPEAAVTLDPRSASVLATTGRGAYLAGMLAVSEERLRHRRRSTGLTEDALARSLRYRATVPQELTQLEQSCFRVLHGPLGSGKSDIAEEWLRTSINTASADPGSAIPMWIAIDDLTTTLESHVRNEVGLETLALAGADVVVDGLDERTDKSANLVRQAGEFVKKWVKSRVLLTSRSTEGLDPGVLTEAGNLDRGTAQRLLETVAGRPVNGLGPTIEATLTRPLFVLLVGQHVSSAAGATGIPEVIDLVVNDILSRNSYSLYTELRALAAETISSGGPVDPTRVASAEVAALIRRSPLVKSDGRTCAFALATFEQWFAAQAILDGATDIDDILRSLQTFSRWRYVLAIVLATADQTKADAMMEALARWNPGAASWVVQETSTAGLTRARPQVGPQDWEVVGERIRRAMAAWLQGLGPLARAFWPYSGLRLTDFDDVALGVTVSESSVWISWSARNAVPDNPLPHVFDTSSRRDGRFWAHSTMMRQLPTAVNGIWSLTRDLIANDLTASFTSMAVGVALQHDGVLYNEARVYTAAMKARNGGVTPNALGNLDIERLYPSGDITPTPQSPLGFTPDRMREYAVSVLDAAMRCYLECSTWITPRFDRTLGHRGLMPIEFFGDMYYEPTEPNPNVLRHLEPGFSWLLRPIGTTPSSDPEQNRVSLTLNDDERARQIHEDYSTLYKAYRRYFEANPLYEPFASPFAVSGGSLDILHRMPASHIALRWLWTDLEQLGFLTSHPPADLIPITA